jgi:hypothetical protein
VPYSRDEGLGRVGLVIATIITPLPLQVLAPDSCTFHENSFPTKPMSLDRHFKRMPSVFVVLIAVQLAIDSCEARPGLTGQVSEHSKDKVEISRDTKQDIVEFVREWKG